MSIPNATTTSFESVLAKADEALNDCHRPLVYTGACSFAEKIDPSVLGKGFIVMLQERRKNPCSLSMEQVKMIFEEVLTEEQRQAIVRIVNSEEDRVRYWWNY